MCRLHFSLYIFSKLKTGTLFCVILSPFHTVPGIRGCILVVLRKLWTVPNVHPGYKRSPRSKVDPRASNISVKQNNRYLTIQGRNLNKYTSIWLNIQFIASKVLICFCGLRRIVETSPACLLYGEWCPCCTPRQSNYPGTRAWWHPLPRTVPVVPKIIHITSSPGLILHKYPILQFSNTTNSV